MMRKIAVAVEMFVIIDIGYDYTALINSIFSPNDLNDIEKAINIISNYRVLQETAGECLGEVAFVFSWIN